MTNNRRKKEYTNFNKNLREFREAQGLTTDEIANLLDIPKNTYLAYESQNREPPYYLLIKISEILNTSINDLLGYTPKEPSDLEKQVAYCRSMGLDVTIEIDKPFLDIAPHLATNVVYSFQIEELSTDNPYKEVKYRIHGENFLKAIDKIKKSPRFKTTVKDILESRLQLMYIKSEMEYQGNMLDSYVDEASDHNRMIIDMDKNDAKYRLEKVLPELEKRVQQKSPSTDIEEPTKE